MVNQTIRVSPLVTDPGSSSLLLLLLLPWLKQ